ncbi:Putative modulator of DNA gyrase [Pseudobutyrivibrio sp. UC1225]|uniref:metallopeptidase TldD-related protein n=1 Tax=Pseudobutyrivibrio sp. UC1225 TaxID=1798185 RepID=UPI0008E05405|nr:metallopeptidase TldD-related protein [Pseudobutyrivibrio sp. UC1225]SFO34080.1 Putative modulator of DNA gyrase [Pseudobutyrivibrio sp. UC1225]
MNSIKTISYTIIKRSGRDRCFYIEELQHCFEFKNGMYSNKKNSVDRKEKAFSLLRVKNIIIGNTCDYAALNEELFYKEKLNDIISFIEYFSKTNDIEYFFKWQVLKKTISSANQNYTLISGGLDVAFLVRGNVKTESIYCFSRDYESLKSKILATSDRIRLIKSFKPSVCDNNISKVLLSGRAAAILIHEAVGHLSEADFFIDNVDQCKKSLYKSIASRKLTIIDDGNINSSGWMPIDDEGEKNKATVLIREGVREGYIHNLNTARVFDVMTTGNARVTNEEGFPRVRMTNTYVQNGDDNLHELVHSEKVLYIDSLNTCYGFKNIFFSPGRCYYLKDGKREDVLIEKKRLSAYKVLNSIIGVGTKCDVLESTVTGCKKGIGLLPVSMSSPQILFSGNILS